MNTKVILTGHSRGLGLGICRALLNSRVSVLGLARSQCNIQDDLLQQVAIDLSSALAIEDWLCADQLSRFVQGAQRLCLINNAGVVWPVAPPDRQVPSEVAAAVGVNVTAPLMLTAAVAAITSASEKRVLHISSGAARSAYPGWSVYCATKAALDHHARAVTTDHVNGLSVVSLAPGIIDTDMQSEIRSTTTQNFPNRDRFVALKEEGLLAGVDTTGHQIVEFLMSAQFGQQVVCDLRA